MNKTTRTAAGRWLRVSVLAALLGSTLSACVPLVVGGAAGATVLALDRRTSGAQLEDQGIETRGSSRINDALQQRGRVSVTSYNRVMLITGQVQADADRELVSSVAAGVPNVRRIVNEVIVNPSATLSQRSVDSMTTTRVKTALVSARSLDANAIKVTTELGTVFLMGIVTQEEADRAAEVARNVGGVLKVVKVFEIISPSQLQPVGAGVPVTSTAPAGVHPQNVGTTTP